MGVYTKIKGNIPWDLRFRVNHFLLDSPRIGLPYMALRKKSFPAARATNCDDVFVDGFPRSANTFAYLLLKDLYGPDLRVVGHGHSASAILESVRLGSATIVLLRNPKECVPSLVQLADGVRLSTAFTAYERFHRQLLPVRREIFIAKFEDVTKDPEAFVRNLHERFELPSRNFRYDATARQRIDDLILSNNMMRHGGQVNEHGLARPTASRRSATQVLATSKEGHARSLARADAVYRELLGGPSL